MDMAWSCSSITTGPFSQFSAIGICVLVNLPYCPSHVLCTHARNYAIHSAPKKILLCSSPQLTPKLLKCPPSPILFTPWTIVPPLCTLQPHYSLGMIIYASLTEHHTSSFLQWVPSTFVWYSTLTYYYYCYYYYSLIKVPFSDPSLF